MLNSIFGKMYGHCCIMLLCHKHHLARSKQVMHQKCRKVSFTDFVSYFGTGIGPLPFSKRSASLSISPFCR